MDGWDGWIYLRQLGTLEHLAVLKRGQRHLHDQVLTPPDELRLCVDDGLEEPQVLHMLPMALNAVDKVLNHLLVHFIAQNGIVLHFCNMSLQNVFNSKAPGRLHTWSSHAAGLDSGTARGVCEAAPGNFQDGIQEHLD